MRQSSIHSNSTALLKEVNFVRLCPDSQNSTAALPTDQDSAKVERHLILRQLIRSLYTFLEGHPVCLAEAKPHYFIDSYAYHASALVNEWGDALKERHDQFIATIKKRENCDPEKAMFQRLEQVLKTDNPVGGSASSLIRAGMGTFIKFMTTISANLPLWIAEEEVRGNRVDRIALFVSVESLAGRLMGLDLFDLKEFARFFSSDDEGSEGFSYGSFMPAAFQISHSALDLTDQTREKMLTAMAEVRATCPHLYTSGTFRCPAAFTKDSEGEGGFHRSAIKTFFSVYATRLGEDLEKAIVLAKAELRTC